MKIRLITIAHKAPAWVQAGFEDYAKRMPPDHAIELIEIAAEKRSANSDIKRLKERESEKLLAASKQNHHLIALDVKGKLWSTAELAAQMTSWQQDGRPLDLIIGGPDGLAESVLKKANQCWSLSPLTFPHLLVRVIVAEQIYRAWSLLNKHPYHR